MKTKLIAALCLALTFSNFGCAAMKRHPVLSGAVIGLAAGVTVAIATHHSCPHMINGYRYDGTPPCPGPDYDPGGKK